jgi:hypothetical protein
MAEKRMFTMKIIDSDAFLDMPLSSQALYFHLNMRADDDGFVNNPKKIQRMVGASDDDLKLLIAKRFILAYESGVIVIKHWRMHNTLRKDRYTPTQYTEEMESLLIKDNGSYTEKIALLPDSDHMATTWQPSGNQLAPQYREDKNSIDKDSIEEIIDAPAPKKPVRHKYGQYKNVLLSVEDMEKLTAEFPYDWKQRIERLSEYMASAGKSYKNHLATIRNWARRDAEKRNAQASGNGMYYMPNQPIEEDSDYFIKMCFPGGK